MRTHARTHAATAALRVGGSVLLPFHGRAIIFFPLIIYIFYRCCCCCCSCLPSRRRWSACRHCSKPVTKGVEETNINVAGIVAHNHQFCTRWIYGRRAHVVESVPADYQTCCASTQSICIGTNFSQVAAQVHAHSRSHETTRIVNFISLSINMLHSYMGGAFSSFI